MKLSEFYATEYRPRRLFGKSENTDRLYQLSIRSFERTLGKSATLVDLTDENLRRHMERVVSNGRSRATANKDRAQLVAIWRLAFSLKMSETMPTVQAFGEPNRVPVAWLNSDLESLFGAIEKQEGEYAGVPRNLWWRALVRLALDTGERIGAIRKAQWCWLSGEWLLVPAESRKGSRSDRSYKLSAETLELLSKMQAARRSGKHIFHFPFCESYLWTQYKKILIAAGLPHGRRDKFHKLRRTTGSVAYAAGLDPQDVLDHQYRRTTQRYLDPRFSRELSPSDVLAQFLANPQPRPLPPQSPPKQQQDNPPARGAAG